MIIFTSIHSYLMASVNVIILLMCFQKYIKCPKYIHTEKKGFKIVPFGVQQPVAGAVPLIKGLFFFTPNRYILY